MIDYKIQNAKFSIAFQSVMIIGLVANFGCLILLLIATNSCNGWVISGTVL